MDAPLLPGYRLEHRLGAGRTAVVWRAHRERDGRAVAVKIVSLDGARGSPGHAAQRAARELALMQAHVSEHILRCHEALPLTEPAPAVALVTDLMRGGSLADVVRARGHLSVGEMVTVVSPVARALASLHVHGVVHADVSASNVLFDRAGRPWLADLGLAVAVGEAQDAYYGTPGFTAPEVALGGPPETAADVYSLGALAWLCLTGEPPDLPVLRPPLAELAPDIPEPVALLVGACLSGDPRARPTAAAAAVAFYDAGPAVPLRLVTPDDDVSLLTRRIRAAAVSVPTATGRGPWGPRFRLPAGTGWPGRLAAAALMLAITVSALGWSRLASADPVPAGPARASPTSPRPGTTASARPLSASESVTSGVGQMPTLSGPAASTERPSQQPERDVLGDAGAARSRPVQVMVALSQRRADAWNAGKEALLARCDAPGSAALEHDRTVLREALAGGRRYSGVAFLVGSARVLASTPTSATVRARVDTTAYQVAVDGHTSSLPGQDGATLDFRLTWVDRSWRVAEVSSATAPR